MHGQKQNLIEPHLRKLAALHIWNMKVPISCGSAQAD